MKLFPVVMLAIGFVLSRIVAVASAVHGESSPPADPLYVEDPCSCLACAPRCWKNSEYVSSCLDEPTCLCQDDGFQSVGIKIYLDQVKTLTCNRRFSDVYTSNVKHHISPLPYTMPYLGVSTTALTVCVAHHLYYAIRNFGNELIQLMLYGRQIIR